MLMRRGFLLDTNVVSEVAKVRPHPGLIAWLIQQAVGSLFISFTVSFETKRGIERLARTKPDKALKLEQWFDEVISSEINYIAQDDPTSRLLAEMTMLPPLRNLWVSHPGKDGPTCGQDLAIAATAITWGLSIATRDIEDYLLINKYFGLPGLVNPFTHEWFVDPDERQSSSPSISMDST